jgi:hypothetical protein
MTIYTSRLILLPDFVNHRRRRTSSYSYQREIFRSTLILLPNSNRKRFIESIEVRCGSFTNEQRLIINNRSTSVSPNATTSDVFSADESICEYYPSTKSSTAGESYFDVQHRLLVKSNLLTCTLKNDTDADDDDSSYCPSPVGYSYYT